MYNPALHTATNKPIGITNKPVDARTYYYDSAAFSYRPYSSQAEVLGYLTGNNRVGQFSIIIGTDEYWFKNGITDNDLILKGGGSSAITVATGTALSLIGDTLFYVISYLASYSRYGSDPQVLIYRVSGSYKIRRYLEYQLNASGNLLIPIDDNDGTITTQPYTIIIKA